ncbi:MAG TPA: methionyl-tRNA formyltransferase, partial [Terrimicrobiaceae bacterium]|nr:methionyl-tRNA formyltransferase [Terrimicrobiaceae bacterium]
MRIVFLGTGDIGVPSLRALAAEPGDQILGVYTQPDRPAGRDLKLRASPVKETALELGLPVFQPPRIRAAESLAGLRSLQPDVIVVVAYGQILPKEILDLPRLGCLNVHASLLPRHRGASPVHAALLAGDAVSGVTIMQMDEGLDTGPILAKVETPIGPRETAGSLHVRLAQLAPEALLQTLRLLDRGGIRSEPQDDVRATYAPKLLRADGEVTWSLPARAIDQRIR